jgi:ribonuclease BN (tRNA processing enzyme)
MKLVLLGTGGYFPTSERQTACLMLPEVGVVFDAGTGMYRLPRHLRTPHLDIFLTHAHLDHVAGLTYLVNMVSKDVLARTTVHGDAAKLAAIREHLFNETIFPVAPPFSFEALSDENQLPNGGTLTHFALEHPGGSIGYRVDWPDHSLAYVTDTTATAEASYLEHIRNVDLLVHEAYFLNDAGDLPKRTGHSSLLTVARLAAVAKVGQLLLTHIDPQRADDKPLDLRPAQQIFQKTIIATDGMEVDF